MSSSERIILLVHDAWLGGWSWEKVTGHLLEQGDQVVTLDLPGHGPNRVDEKITLETYARAVINTAGSYSDKKIILVGHGTAGPVIQLAAETLGNQVAGLIFINGFILRDGESIASQMPPEIAAFFKSMADSNPETCIDLSLIPDFWRFNVMNDAPVQAEQILTRLVPEPAIPLFESIRLNTFFEKRPPCGYISFNEDMTLPPGDYYPRMANKLGKYRHVNINAGHEGILTKPREVAEAIYYLLNLGLL
ncbi:MAG TPA: alpha/beta hydrolase [Chloroflexia bacterium]|nr:alpha/beta hydrolase [Chloroflexia bacterium]